MVERGKKINFKFWLGYQNAVMQKIKKKNHYYSDVDQIKNYIVSNIVIYVT